MTHRCRDCRKAGEEKNMFNLRTGGITEASRLGCRAWAIVIYLTATSLKGVSSMKLHRDLGITQKTAWHFSHRIRRAFEDGGLIPFAGPVEIDETYVGGKKKRGVRGHGPMGKAVVAGAKDRRTNLVRAKAVPDARKASIQPFVMSSAEIGSLIYTDDARVYLDIPWYRYEAVKHSAGSTSGIRPTPTGSNRSGRYSSTATRARSTRCRTGTWTATRRNSRGTTTSANWTPLDQMGWVADGMRGKRLKQTSSR